MKHMHLIVHSFWLIIYFYNLKIETNDRHSDSRRGLDRQVGLPKKTVNEKKKSSGVLLSKQLESTKERHSNIVK